MVTDTEEWLLVEATRAAGLTRHFENYICLHWHRTERNGFSMEAIIHFLVWPLCSMPEVLFLRTESVLAFALKCSTSCPWTWTCEILFPCFLLSQCNLFLHTNTYTASTWRSMLVTLWFKLYFSTFAFLWSVSCHIFWSEQMWVNWWFKTMFASIVSHTREYWPALIQKYCPTHISENFETSNICRSCCRPPSCT
jgi:hypothetical protein